MKTYIFTGRFQPLHLGHISFLKTIKQRYPSDLLIVCILRNSKRNESPKIMNDFYLISKAKQIESNNPLPNWNRYMLLSLAIKDDPLLRNNTIILFRNRSDIDWEESIADLPEKRIWVFPRYTKEKFDEEKVKYYKEKKESIEIIDCDEQVSFSGTTIRKSLIDGDRSLEFLPLCCRDYFRDECLKYF